MNLQARHTSFAPCRTPADGGGGASFTLKTFRSGRDNLANTRRVKAWVIARFRLNEDETVMVNEVACELPGCPPIETVIAFWTADGTRHHYKIFKPVAEVVEDDLPPSWMKDALAVSGEFDFLCC